MSRDLSKAIKGVFIGTLWGLTVLTYWGYAPYQIIISIVTGALFGYFAVARRQAWQQVKLAWKKATSDWPKNLKKMINKATSAWGKTPYHTKRTIFLVLLMMASFVILKLQPRILSPDYMGPFTIFITAYTLLSVVVFKDGINFNIFNCLFKSKIINGREKVSQLRAAGKKMEMYSNGKRVLLYDAPWWYYESRMLLVTFYVIFMPFTTIFLWTVLSIALIFVAIVRFLFWLPVILSTQDLFVKIFTGTAFSVMAGVHYQSYAVGFGIAGVFSLVLIILKRFIRQPFKLFAFLGKESVLNRAFARTNLFDKI